MFLFQEHKAGLVSGERSEMAEGKIRSICKVAIPAIITTTDLKKLAIISIVVVAFAFTALAPSTNPQRSLAVIVPATATPVVLGGAGIYFRTVVFIGLKSARTNNTGRVWIQLSSTDGDYGIPLMPGQSVSVSSASTFSADDFWVDVETAADGVVAILLDNL